MGRLYIVTSGKGGTGKTTVAVNLAAALADRGAGVAAVDMCIGFRNMDLFLGKENDIVYDSSDVIRGVCTIDQALVKDDRFSRLYLLAAAPEHEDGVSLSRIHALLLTLKGRFDHVIVDMPSGAGRMTADLAEAADRVILVSTADYASIRNTDAFDRRLKALGSDKQTVLINRLVPEFMNERVVPRLREINAMIQPDIAGVIQEDRVLQVSANLGIPAYMKKDTYIRKNFDAIAEKL